MPQLPHSRVAESQLFLHTGIDYLGPSYIKTSCDIQKVWICLYTCLVTRAIHLELMQDMSTEDSSRISKIHFTERFFERVISDNAFYFKTASKVLVLFWKNALKDEDVQSFSSNNRIKWSFILELAPWIGGFYERVIGLMTRPFRKALGCKLLSNVQIQTDIKEIEASINS